MPTLTTLIQHSYNNREEIKGIQIVKEVVKPSLFADDRIYTQNILKMLPENY